MLVISILIIKLYIVTSIWFCFVYYDNVLYTILMDIVLYQYRIVLSQYLKVLYWYCIVDKNAIQLRPGCQFSNSREYNLSVNKTELFKTGQQISRRQLESHFLSGQKFIDLLIESVIKLKQRQTRWLLCNIQIRFFLMCLKLKQSAKERRIKRTGKSSVFMTGFFFCISTQNKNQIFP